MSDEISRIQEVSSFYLNDQLSIDDALLKLRFETITPWLRGSSCLELGPGDGKQLPSLLEIFSHVTVVDGSEALLDNIRLNSDKLEKVHTLFEHFSTENKFDCIIADHVLEHVADPQLILRQMRNWLAPGGTIIVGVPNANSLHRLAAVKMGILNSQYELNERDQILGHRRVYSPEQLREEIEHAGLQVSNMFGVFLKPFSNQQIEASFSYEMILGFYELGKDFPEIAAETYAICELL